MNELRKNAYRHLLYMAMLDIRGLCQSRGLTSLDPLVWRQRYDLSRLAGALADWLHNLAKYASRDFEGFSEELFWQDCERLCLEFGNDPFSEYPQHFEQRLNHDQL